MKTSTNKSSILPTVKVREYYVEKSALFGLITWDEVVKTETIGSDIFIKTDNKIDNIYLNGKKI